MPIDSKLIFKNHFGYTPVHTTYAPGVVELLGSQSASNDGLSLLLAIDKKVSISSAPRYDGRVEIISDDMQGKPSTFWVTNQEPTGGSLHLDIVRAVMGQLRRHGVGFGGFNAAIHNSIPSPNLGDNTALATAVALTIRKLYPYRLTETGSMINPPPRDKYGRVTPPIKAEMRAIASLCHRVESALVETPPAKDAQLACLFGKKYHALCIDNKFDSIEFVPIYGQIAIILFEFESEGESFKTLQKQIAEQCRAAAIALRGKSLRSVDLPYLKSNKHLLTQRQYDCAYHTIAEIQRVIYAIRALQEGDFEQFGYLMLLSYESLRDYLKNTTSEVDLLIELARKMQGFYGARMIERGSGYATINLVSADHYQEFINRVTTAFKDKTGRTLNTVICIACDGAQ